MFVCLNDNDNRPLIQVVGMMVHRDIINFRSSSYVKVTCQTLWSQEKFLYWLKVEVKSGKLTERTGIELDMVGKKAALNFEI